MFPRLQLLLAAVSLLTPRAGAADRVSFNRDIRPIFSDTCFQCHGPDEAKRKANLRLDQRETAVKPAKSGETAIVPGKPEESELVKRLLATDPDDIMPPARLHKQITPAQIETVKRWIAEGAEYQGHWAFIAPERPPVPPVADKSALVHNPIDAFLLARLAKDGLKQSPEADRRTLLRRVSLDLTGTPPTPAEAEAFVADRSPGAYEKVVDRLLASPRYGERMATQWLDFARYADSNGFQSDTSRQMWHWRDWVIEAFNRNQPFDQFTIEQLAGDLLPNPTQAQIVATGFNRNLRLNGEGGRIVEEWFAETVIDRIETTSATWMGLTMGCCRCHDHKFDPITQKEFYQFFSYFNSVDENGVLDEFGGSGPTRGGGNSRPILALANPEQLVQEAKLEAAIKTADERAAEAQKRLPQLQAAWEKKFIEQTSQGPATWETLAPTAVKSTGGATFTPQADGSWLASGKSPATDTYTVTAPLAPGELTGLRVEALPDPSLPDGRPGRAANGNFLLTGLELEITAPSLPQQVTVEFARAEADFEQKGYAIKLLVEEAARKKGDKSKKGWAIDGPEAVKRLPRTAMFVTATPVAIPPEATVIVRLKHESNFPGHTIGRLRLATTSLAPALVKIEGGGLPESLRTALATEPAKRTPAQRTELAKFYRENTDNPASRAAAEAAEARKKLTDLKNSFPTTMVMKELPAPRDAFILKRGEYDKKGDKVERGLPAALPPLPPGAPNNRLGLAQWLVAPNHPLTARVWVNRAWEKFFGIGLVRTTENLGSQAEWPSNPDLLDWLATEFIRLKWDMKAMQKTMVMSAAYRQSSQVTPELLSKDPENRLLARGPRFRLPAELIRDQALAASGLLVEKIGGPSVRPYMPANVWDETSKYGDLRGYKAETGEGLYRRSLYTFWKRTASPPSMTMFDSPTREICTVKRSRTNTPLQALSLLNEVTFVEAARVLAQRMISEGGATPEARIAWAFQRTAGRPPSAPELTILTAGLTKRLTKLETEPAEAKKLITQGTAPVDTKENPIELAAYTVTANVLLNLDEVVTRE